MLRYAGWRWIFIIEGLVTIVIGAAAFFFIPDYPETAKWLSEEEKNTVVRRLKTKGLDSSGNAVKETDSFQWAMIRRALLDWQVWLGALINIGNSDIIYGMSYFLPTIVNELGYSGNAANLLTIPVYVCACIVVVVMCFLSDRFHTRSAFILCLMTGEFIGFIFTLVGSVKGGLPGLVYAGCFIAVSCCYASFVLTVVGAS